MGSTKSYISKRPTKYLEHYQGKYQFSFHFFAAMSSGEDSDKDAKDWRKGPRTAYDIQRSKLEKLMKNPEKPVNVPQPRKEKDPNNAPDFVYNVMGSSAGAGSGEFHVYRQIRRKEFARQKVLDDMKTKDELNEAYHAKLEENEREAEERTAKKRAKRQKKKAKQKQNKRPKKANLRVKILRNLKVKTKIVMIMKMMKRQRKIKNSTNFKWLIVIPMLFITLIRIRISFRINLDSNTNKSKETYDDGNIVILNEMQVSKAVPSSSTSGASNNEHLSEFEEPAKKIELEDQSEKTRKLNETIKKLEKDIQKRTQQLNHITNDEDEDSQKQAKIQKLNQIMNLKFQNLFLRTLNRMLQMMNMYTSLKLNNLQRKLSWKIRVLRFEN